MYFEIFNPGNFDKYVKLNLNLHLLYSTKNENIYATFVVYNPVLCLQSPNLVDVYHYSRPNYISTTVLYFSRCLVWLFNGRFRVKTTSVSLSSSLIDQTQARWQALSDFATWRHYYSTETCFAFSMRYQIQRFTTKYNCRY